MDHLNDLPRFTAPDGLWDRLETNMFSIETAALPVMTPSSGVWNSLERKLVLKKRISKAAIIGLLILAIAIPGYFIYTHFNSDHGLSGVEVQKIIKSDHVIPSEVEGQPDIESQTVIPSTSGSIGRQRLTDDDAISANPVEENGDNAEDLEEVESSPTTASENKSVEEVESSSTKALQDKSVTSIESVESGDRKVKGLEKLEMRDGKVVLNSFVELEYRDGFDRCNSFYGSTHEFFWGPSYEYQLFLDGDTYLDTEQKYWQSARVNGKFCFGKFFLESGIGISLARDKTPYHYDYTSYELINSYEYVDSVDYDPVSGETIYYTSFVDVYDSVPHSTSSSVGKTYNYLRFPLFVGIKLFKGQSFGSSLSGGIIYNLLISKNTTEISYDEPGSRITSVSFTETTRIENNFSLSLHLNFEWELSDNHILYAYPSFNYYLNSLYTNDTEGQPISVGLGVGLWIK